MLQQVNKYKTQARHIQGQDLMENHVANIKTPTSALSNPALLVHPAGEDWPVIDQATDNQTLQPGRETRSSALEWERPKSNST